MSELAKVGLDAKNIVAASFDGGSNFSGARKGVQALLKEYAPDLFVHCRAHLLQLTQLNACELSREAKAVISSLNQHFTLFSTSHKRLAVLHDVEMALSGVKHTHRACTVTSSRKSDSNRLPVTSVRL